jgi:hypothetical protein
VADRYKHVRPFRRDNLKPWTVRVLPEAGDGLVQDFRVFAVESTDAQIIAYAMAGGFAKGTAVMEESDRTIIELYTEIIE